VSFFLPGDICDLKRLYLRRWIIRSGDHRAQGGGDRPRRIRADDAGDPRIAQALFWDELVTVSVQREWTLNLGQRTAYERISHFSSSSSCGCRRSAGPRARAATFPLTQVDIADASGLTAVHVNRTLQELRKEG
jgi:CRP-like cAMP-binding protein